MGTKPHLFGPNRQYERWRWQIFAITWLAYAGFYLTRKCFAVAKIEMGKPTSLGLTDIQMSWVDGAFLTAYAAGQFLWGPCGDRYGPRKVVAFGMLGSVIAAVAMGSVSFVVPLVIFSCVQGLCQATGWSPLAKNIGSFFSRSERGTVMGLWLTNYAVGGFVASVYAGYVGGLFGWRYAFWIPALTLAVILLLFIGLQRNKPEDVGLPPIEIYHQENEEQGKASESPVRVHEGSWKIALQVLRNPMVLLLALVYFF